MTRVVPTMGQAIPGNYDTAAFWTANVQALGEFLLNPPLFIGWYAGTAVAVPNNIWTHMLLDTEIIDTDGGHDTTANSQRYTCQVPGWYELNGQACFVSGGTGLRGAKFMVNTNTSVPGSENLVAPGGSVATTVPAVTSYVHMAVGDYVELFAFQNSGGPLNTMSNGTGDFANALSCRWVGV